MLFSSGAPDANKGQYRASLGAHLNERSEFRQNTSGLAPRTFMQFTKNVKLHSREHLLADDLSRMLGEEKRFAAYLGIAKRYYESDLRALARRVREKQDLPAEARGKYFFAALRDKPRRDKKKRRRKKITRKRHAKKSRNPANRQSAR